VLVKVLFAGALSGAFVVSEKFSKIFLKSPSEKAHFFSWLVRRFFLLLIFDNRITDNPDTFRRWGAEPQGAP